MPTESACGRGRWLKIVHWFSDVGLAAAKVLTAALRQPQASSNPREAFIVSFSDIYPGKTSPARNEESCFHPCLAVNPGQAETGQKIIVTLFIRPAEQVLPLRPLARALNISTAEDPCTHLRVTLVSQHDVHLVKDFNKGVADAPLMVVLQLCYLCCHVLLAETRHLTAFPTA